MSAIFEKTMQVLRNDRLNYLFKYTKHEFEIFKIQSDSIKFFKLKSELYGKKIEYFHLSMKITSNEFKVFEYQFYIIKYRKCKLGMNLGEENLLLVKRRIYFLILFRKSKLIKSWQRRFHTADVEENKAKIRDNEYVATDARLLNLYARRLFKLFLMASHEMPRP